MFCSRSCVLPLVLSSLSAFTAFAAPSGSALIPRDAINASLPKFNAFARIRDRNGVDVSSSFKVKVYQHNPNAEISNFTETHQLNDRQVRTVFIKTVGQCYANETFVESHCTPKDEEEGSLQSFEYTCEKLVPHYRGETGEFLGNFPALRKRNGHCDAEELCVDGFAPPIQRASCIYGGLFDDFMIDKDGRLKGMIGGEIFDVEKASAMLSETDESTPTESGSMGMSSWADSSILSKGSVQTKKCRDCVQLKSDTLRPTTDSLRVEATLMSTGAVAGVLWLVFLSG